MEGSLTAGWRAQIVARVVELRPVVLALMRESVPDELQAGFGHATGRQLQALACLPGNGMTMGELAAFLRVSGAAASVLADRLVGQDLAVRDADPSDRRVVRLVPTPEGMALAERYRENQRRAVAALLDRLSDAQVVAWLDVMETLASGRGPAARAAAEPGGCGPVTLSRHERPGTPAPAQAGQPDTDPYKGRWSTLSNTTLGMLMATIDASIVLISLPDIFRGIQLNPLTPGNTSYFLWMLMGYMLVTAVLVVSFGRLGDMFGRVRMYNLGFVVFTVFSILLSVTWMHGPAAAIYMIVMRVFQGVGGALIMANSGAIITDAFPRQQRGLALGINAVAAIAGSFIGLVLGGVLAPVNWRLVFWVSVPVGVAGTIWGYINLKDRGIRTPARIDWAGNATFAAGLVAILVGIVYGIEPYGGHVMGWTNPLVLAALGGGVVLLASFAWIETRVPAPMFRLQLFRIRAFTAGNLASFLAALGRGGLMFILIIWLQGIWLPRHGYSFSQTPLWAGIYMLPMTGGFLIAGPVSGWLSDRFGARPFATGGMLLAALTFALLEVLPVNFSYSAFAVLLIMNGLAMGLFASPNRAAIMNSLPADQRGQGSGMSTTAQNSAMVLSIGIFFTLIITGLAARLPVALARGLTAQGVPAAAAAKVAALPPTATVFGAFLGYNPIASLLGPTGVLAHLPKAKVAYLTGRSFFPDLISGPFSNGLHEAFDFAIVAMLIAAAASWLRGKPSAQADPSLASRAVLPLPAQAAVAPAPTLNGSVPGAAPSVPAGSVPGAAPSVPAGDSAGRYDDNQ